MSIFKRNEPLEVDKQVVHQIRKELRPEYENLRQGLKDMEQRLLESQQIASALRTELYSYIMSVDKLLQRLED